MRSMSGLILLASLVGAETVPVLSEPHRSDRLGGYGLQAWGDTLYSTGWNSIQKHVRESSRTRWVDSIGSPWIDAMASLRLPMENGTDLLVTSNALLQVDWRSGNRGVIKIPLNGAFQLGSNRPEGGVFRPASDPTVQHLVLCGMDGLNNGWSGAIYELANRWSAGWTVVDSHTTPRSGRVTAHCDVDTSTNRSVTAWIPDPDVPETWISNDSIPGLVRDAKDTSKTFHRRGVFLSAVMAAYDSSWLGYDAKTGTILLGGGGVRDSLRFPGLASRSKPSTVAPVRQDSLVVFGTDSSVFLAKWTPAGFRMLDSICPGIGAIQALAIADSTLWVGAAKGLYSFRIRWSASPSTALAEPKSRLSTLEIHRSGASVEIRWHGSRWTWTELIDASGRIRDRFELFPGQSRTVSTGPVGARWIRTSEGVSRIR